ncbi:hypothetical protein [Adhaeretor mobilis]|uniref:Uncharacterized protein n=1 Tax=Adhaeretor mobilis TaxID=1930276 RepID=A0A517N0X9_9BACT|nr:hypothetical protein [Adhaeretor mobilis]QDT00790.1 hypothetical protein HG15A2_41320 [Adhaeretor mobilis]
MIARSRTSRAGSILIGVLVCLAIATSIVTTSVRTALDTRRALRTQHQVRQTELLLAAGIQRAWQQLQSSADYRGETWELPAGTIPSLDAAQVEIAIGDAAKSIGDESTVREVQVTARLSVATRTIKRSYRFSTEPEATNEP